MFKSETFSLLKLYFRHQIFTARRRLSEFPSRFSTVNKSKNNINSILLRNPQLINSMVRKKTPIRTKIFLGIGTIAISLILYVGFQLWTISKHPEKGGMSVFVPLWLNFNLLYSSKYKFPWDLKYFDMDLYEYTFNDMETSFTTDSKNKNQIEQYIKSFQDKNVKYKVLEKIIANRALRNEIQIPIELEDDKESFQIWIETLCPTISGVQISGNGIEWKICLFNIRSLIESALFAAGLKLNRLERTEANRKVHERASGRIHEVQPNASKNKHNKGLLLNKTRDFDIWFTGNFSIKPQRGLIKYKGKIDFDHFMINRGVKLIGLTVNLEGADGAVSYKVM